MVEENRMEWRHSKLLSISILGVVLQALLGLLADKFCLSHYNGI